MKVRVGSKNPVKIQAVKEAFEMFFDDVTITGQNTESGVAPQPKNLQDILKGTENRAKNSFGDCDLSVGIESGIFPLDKTLTGYVNICAVMIYDGKNFVGVGFTPGFEYPPAVIRHLVGGDREAAHICDDIFNRTDSKHQEGAIGIFSHGKYTRRDFTKAGVIMALCPLLNPEHYRR